MTTPQLTVRSSGHIFLECPRWHDNSLYATDIFAHQVLRWGDKLAPEVVCEVPGQPAGLGWDLDGNLLVVSMTDHRLLRLVGSELVEVADLSEWSPGNSNDMVVDETGAAYIGNFGWDPMESMEIKPAVLLRVEPDGTVAVVAEDLICANGMSISPDGGTLYVNESFGARITAFDRAADGSLSNRRTWASFTDDEFTRQDVALGAGVILPDGMALDAEGAIWVGDCRGTGVSRVAEGGEILDYISTGDQASYACALGGGDRRMLFLVTALPFGQGDVTAGNRGKLQCVPVPVAGAGRP